jgi:hypothetical protein
MASLSWGPRSLLKSSLLSAVDKGLLLLFSLHPDMPGVTDSTANRHTSIFGILLPVSPLLAN